jgi:hypothetical protein
MKLFVKPKPGKILRDPRNNLPLPESGKDVPSNSFWIRRLNAGDVELANKKKADKAEREKSKDFAKPEKDK